MDRYSNLGDPDEVSEEVSHEEEASGRFSEEEKEDGLDGSRFSYLFNFFGLPFCLIPLLRKDNAYSLYHAKQAFVLWAVFMGSLVIGWALLWITLQALWIFLLGGGAALALNVVGYQRVMEENESPLPVVGALAERWFSELKADGAGEDDSED